MRKAIIVFMSLLCLASIVACNDYETYGEKKDKERKAIKQYIADSGIVVITEAQFHENGDVTDVSKNEYVYLNNSGVYMQIIHKGCGKPLQDGENTDIIVRFLEVNLLDTTALYNDSYPYNPDFMNVRRSGSTYSAVFTEGMMYNAYSTSVPNGWLAAFPYLNMGRPRTADDHIAKVRLIVPHSQGHITASNYVYPYFYELTLQRKIDTNDTD